ncbi:MAG: pentapeptide repeat-containing protein [Desulfotalea sp.]
MKTFKENHHSFYPRPIAIAGKFYLSVGILGFYDLSNPSTFLTEQEMWKTLPLLLGDQPIIDQGVPKPRGEFLVTGSCFAPRGEFRPASEVAVQVGGVEKRINVFGPRYWKDGLISQAELFAEMPVSWDNSFGGKEFSRNPLGKGIDKVELASGNTFVPLPNLEYPNQQIGSPDQIAEPAGFGPIDTMWPQRFSKNGTYDEKWKSERWPYFPDDMNYEFFNMASEDQFLDSFYQGGESVIIKNMHPDLPIIESSLPTQRMRCFVTLDPTFKPHKFPVADLPSAKVNETDMFHEVETRLETAWFFPSVMRGLLIYRGMIEIKDEDRGDVLRVLIRDEEKLDEPKSVEYYRDLQVKLLDRGVEIDNAPLEEAMQKANKSLLKIKNIPKTVDEFRQKALGNRPSMPMLEPEEMLAKSKKMLAAHSANLNNLEAMTQKAHAQSGHLLEIDLGVFDRFRSKMAALDESIENTTKKLSLTKKKLLAESKKEVDQVRGKLKGIDPKYLTKTDFDPDESLPENFPFHSKENPWHDRGFPFVVECRKRLEDDHKILALLKGLEIDRKTINRYWLGVNDEPRLESVGDWGIKGDTEFEIPAGLIFPRFDGHLLSRVKCFADYGKDGNEILVPDSDETPFFIPSATLIELATMPAAENAPIVIVEDELQALFIEQEVGDFCSILALKDPNEDLGDDVAEYIEKAGPILVVRPFEWQKDTLLKAGWSEWLALDDSLQAIELEFGKTVFESHKKGNDIRQWVLDHLPSEFTTDHKVGATIPAGGKHPGKDFMKGFMPQFPDIKAIVAGVHDEVTKHLESKFEPITAERDKMLASLKKTAAKYEKHGVDPARITLDSPPGIKESATETGQKIAGKIRQQGEDLKKRGLLTDEIAAKLKQGASEAERLGVEGDALKEKLTMDFEAKKIELKEGLEKLKNKTPPEGMVEKINLAGIDVEAIRPVTREELVKLHKLGKPVAGAILSGVDLSELDLTGIDLSRCQLKKTSFQNSKLDNAKFEQAMGGEINFSGASLKGSLFERAILADANFENCDLSEMNGNNASFKGGNFSGACLANACLEMAILNEINFTKANCAGVTIHMCMVSGKADKANFANAKISKCIFKDVSLSESDFSNATINETQFNGGGGEGINFYAADLTKMYTARNAIFEKSNFNRAVMNYATLREGSFSGSTFNKGDLENCMFENSKLTKCDFVNCYAKGASFTKCNLEGSVMRACNIMMGGMKKARLVDVDLRGSNLFAVDFYKVVLGNTRFEGANLKRSQLQDRLDLLEENDE